MMLVHFSLTNESGMAIVCYNESNFAANINDFQLLSGFLTAFQILSERIGSPIEKIHLANFVLYIRSYGDFSIRLAFNLDITDIEMQQIYEKLSKEAILFFQMQPELQSEQPFKKTIFSSILSSFLDTAEKINLSTSRKVSTKKIVSKIAILGLANAGKTTIVNSFFEQLPKKDSLNTKPTIDVKTFERFNDFLKQNIVVLDFGGQITYRKSYLERKAIWRDLNILIFIVDLQDRNSLHEAADYLQQIWEMITKVSNNIPRVGIWFHKYDLNLRNAMSDVISESLVCFTKFKSLAIFQLTTIDDDSIIQAMIKTLYFSLPDIILKRLFEDQFLDYIEQKILPEYNSLLYRDVNLDDLQINIADIKKSALVHGIIYSLKFQEHWIQYILGDWQPHPRQLTANAMDVKLVGNQVFLSIKTYTDQKFSRDLFIIIVTSILEGIMQTLRLKPPKLYKSDDVTAIWVLDM